MIIIAVVIVLAIAQLYVSANLDGTLERVGLGAFKWVKHYDVPPEVTPEPSKSFANLYTEENLGGTRTHASDNEVYVFCSQRGGHKTWNFKSIDAEIGQVICFFSRSHNSADSAAHFVIYRRPIRDLESFLNMFPDIVRANTGIYLYGWEHHDLDFCVMPVTAPDYRRMVGEREDQCKKNIAEWDYTDKQNEDYCQFTDPFS
jgi:hypothetical protein